MIGEVPVYGINETFVHQRKSLVLILVKETQNFAYNGNNGYLFVNGKYIFKFKANNESVSLPTQFLSRKHI